MNKRLKGYVFTREFGSMRVPVPMQSLFLRDYCSRNNDIYVLHSGENIFPDSFIVLNAITKNITQFDGLVMTSLFMLPNDAGMRLRIFKEFIDNGKSMHFILENIILASSKDVKSIEELIQIRYSLKFTPDINELKKYI